MQRCLILSSSSKLWIILDFTISCLSSIFIICSITWLIFLDVRVGVDTIVYVVWYIRHFRRLRSFYSKVDMLMPKVHCLWLVWLMSSSLNPIHLMEGWYGIITLVHNSVNDIQLQVHAQHHGSLLGEHLYLMGGVVLWRLDWIN